jgi:hypothetical protein
MIRVHIVYYIGGIIMKANRIFAGIFLLVLMAMMPIALADDSNSVVDANTEREIKTMNTIYGAEVRMLQLEKSISRNILVGAKVLEVIAINNPQADLNDAQNLLNQLEALLLDVQNFDLNQDKNTLVTNFVAMKKEAIDIAKEFKEITSTMLTEDDKQQIKEEIKDMDKTELNNLNQAIKEAIRSANADRMQGLLTILGVSDPELVQDIEDGNATKQEVKDALKGAFKDLNSEERKIAAAKIKEQLNKRIAAEKYAVNVAIENGWERVLEREKEKMERLSEWMHEKGIDANANGYEIRAKRMEQMSEKIKKFIEKINEGLSDSDDEFDDDTNEDTNDDINDDSIDDEEEDESDDDQGQNGNGSGNQ